ncbi:MAG: type II toxin-antitoxin system mRNA interferase toxin, RelE/StbE family [bacterium]
MKINYINRSSRFKRAYKHLPNNIKDDFDKKIIIFIKDPKDLRLRTHILKGKLQECLAFCLRDGFRVLFEFTGDTINLLDVESHDKYKIWKK